MKTIKEITPTILSKISKIDEFKGKWSQLRTLAPDRLRNLKKIATIASVGSSTRIEGAKLSDKEVESLLSHISNQSFQSRDEEEVMGYAETMDFIFDSYNEIPITENHIKQLHALLLKHSSKDQSHKGSYKKLSNNVEAFDERGKSIGIVFETSTPFETPFKMEKLISWYNKSIDNDNQHPLLNIALFIVHFLAVHPFQDGNGRLSRTLTTLMLLKMGYQYVPYCSLESIIEENKDQYYRTLRTSQSTLYTNQSTVNIWIEFFLKSLTKQTDILNDKIEKEKLDEFGKLSKLSEKILLIAEQNGQVTVSDVLLQENVHRNTIKMHIKDLVKNKFLDSNGSGKGTFYTRIK
jgi:Fic family protein